MEPSVRELDYVVSIRPERHLIDIELQLDIPAQTRVELAIPSWIPGSYFIRDFARFLSEFDLQSPSGEAQLEHADKGRWFIASPHSERVTLRYSAYAHELTVRTPHVDTGHAFFNGANVFLFPTNDPNAAYKVDVIPPDGWSVWAPLPRDGNSFTAPNWDRLADTAFEIGPHRVDEFEVDGIPHRIIYWGDDAVPIDYEKLVDDTRAIVIHNRDFFGQLPYDQYEFILHITGSGRGGLEHSYGTTLATSYSAFENDEDYLDLLTLITHEHFHVWNVKRLRPVELGPFDYLRENPTRGLWVVEGFTSYFDEWNTHRAQLMAAEVFIKRLAKSIDRLNSTPGRKTQSVADASFDAWIRLYRPDEDTVNRTVSYYLKGQLAALALDLLVREKTFGRKSLALFTRHLFEKYPVDGPGYDEITVLGELAEWSGVGEVLSASPWIYGTTELPLSTLLETHGVALQETPGDGFRVGATTRSTAGGVEIRSIMSDGPNIETELLAGDILIAVEGRRVSSSDLSKRVDSIGNRGDLTTSAHVFRHDRLVEIELAIAPRPPKTTLSLIDDPSDAALHLRELWLDETQDS